MGLLDLDYKPTDEDKAAARNFGMLAAGLGILANNRGNFGEAVGAGGLQGLNAYQATLHGQKQDAMERLKLQQQMQQFQTQQRIGDFLSGAPAQYGQGQVAGGTPSQAQRYRMAGDMLAGADPIKAKAYYEIADKLSPKAESPGSILRSPDGQVVGVLPNIEKGIGADTPEFNRDFANMAARLAMLEGARTRATEGAKAGYDPQTITGADGRPRMLTRGQIVGQLTVAAPRNPTTPASFPRVNTAEQGARDTDRNAILREEYANEIKIANDQTATPEKRATAMRNIEALSKELRIPIPQEQTQPGIPLQSEAERVAAVESAKANVEIQKKTREAEAKQSQASGKVMPLLDQADEILKSGTTGSAAGALFDTAAGLVGKSTQGAQKAAQLKALQGAIMMNQPRMEGPQSDKDTMLYREMAGQIGDATIPIETRRAAIKGIREMHAKYTNGGQTQTKATKTPVKRGMYNGRRVIQYSDGSVDYE